MELFYDARGNGNENFKGFLKKYVIVYVKFNS